MALSIDLFNHNTIKKIRRDFHVARCHFQPRLTECQELEMTKGEIKTIELFQEKSVELKHELFL